MLLRAGERIVASMSTETFQIPIEAAEQYEANFVPAFFAQWAARLCAAAGVAPGQRVLDVACGTGIVARTASEIVGADGAVVGVDLNEAMLTVARRVAPDLEWRAGDAGALPVDDAVLRRRAVPDGVDVLPRPAAGPPRDGARGHGRRQPSRSSSRAHSPPSPRTSRSSRWRRAMPVPRP